MKPLEPEEDALAALLERASLPRQDARVFVALARGGSHSATDLAAATGLTRQAAGDAANALELAGYVRTEHVASGGRPSKRYHLASTREALDRLIARRRAALAEELAALDALAARVR